MPGNFTQASIRSADSHPQSRELARAEMLLDRFKAVVTATASFSPQTNLAKRQIGVVHYYQDPFERNLVKRSQRRNRLAARVHVGPRFTKDHFVATRLQSSDARLELRLDRKSTRLNSSHGYISYAV